LGVLELCFCRGFRENEVADGGFLMVNLWWNAGERWSENDLNLPAKIFHFSRIYFGFSHFGNRFSMGYGLVGYYSGKSVF
jgi:hypothetical protein